MEAEINKPSSVRIRKLEPWIINTHANLAKNEGISLEAYFRKLLEREALRPQQEFALLMEKRRAQIAEETGSTFPPGADIVRAVREDSCS